LLKIEFILSLSGSKVLQKALFLTVRGDGMQKMYAKVYISMGANLGDPVASHRRAIALLRAHPHIHRLRVSRLYRTSPMSCLPQPDYFNSACEFMTDLSPLDTLQLMQEIEQKLGKGKKHKDAPRLFDIDIVLYGNKVIHSEQLQIPHPYWGDRLFVLCPLFDLAPKIGPYDVEKRIQELRKSSVDRIELLEELL